MARDKEMNRDKEMVLKGYNSKMMNIINNIERTTSSNSIYNNFNVKSNRNQSQSYFSKHHLRVNSFDKHSILPLGIQSPYTSY